MGKRLIIIMKKILKYIANWIKELGEIWSSELKRIFSDGGVLLMFFGATLIYPLIYGICYNPEVLKNIPLAVIDFDKSQTSAKTIQMIDATEQVEVRTNALSMAEAKKDFYDKKVNGIVVIPENFEKDIIKGKQTSIIIYADASYMLCYKQTLQGVTSVIQSKNENIKLRKLQNEGATYSQAAKLSNPVKFTSEALYNPTSGYGSYLMPVLLIIIIQQSLLIGIGMLAGSNKERGAHSFLKPLISLKGGVARLIAGKTLAYITIYLPVSIIMLYLIPIWFGFPNTASILNTILFVLPFLVAVCFFGLLLSSIFRSREQSIMVLLFTSVPLILISGFSWPKEAFPWGFEYISKIFPSTHAARAYVKLAVMGVPFTVIKHELYSLIPLAILFVSVNWAILHRIYIKRK